MDNQLNNQNRSKNECVVHARTKIKQKTDSGVPLDYEVVFPRYNAKRRFIFHHAGRDWFLPGLDVAYGAMEEL